MAEVAAAEVQEERGGGGGNGWGFSMSNMTNIIVSDPETPSLFISPSTSCAQFMLLAINLIKFNGGQPRIASNVTEMIMQLPEPEVSAQFVALHQQWQTDGSAPEGLGQLHTLSVEQKRQMLIDAAKTPVQQPPAENLAVRFGSPGQPRPEPEHVNEPEPEPNLASPYPTLSLTPNLTLK